MWQTLLTALLGLFVLYHIVAAFSGPTPRGTQLIGTLSTACSTALVASPRLKGSTPQALNKSILTSALSLDTGMSGLDEVLGVLNVLLIAALVWSSGSSWPWPAFCACLPHVVLDFDRALVLTPDRAW